jgi:sterol desaturase/sphingolipid hydroxylase (fatty acid hydroxylase superfamily)
MHRTHHSALRDEHDSNYGVIFSWWDLIFRTFDARQPKDIGLSGIAEKTILDFLLFPFRKK